MKQGVSLNYTLGEGWLAPWLEGLRQGKARASTCSGCGAAHFPPLRTCPDCRVPSDGWRVLRGCGLIVHRTTGTDGDFAMVRFDGARGAAIVRADRLPAATTRVVLAPCHDDPPRLAVIPEPRI